MIGSFSYPDNHLNTEAPEEMDERWSELKVEGIEVEERQLSHDEFERLFGGERTFLVNETPDPWIGIWLN